MEDESIIKVEIHYKNKRFDFSQDNCINLSEIIEVIKDEINFQDEKDLQIYHIDDNQKITKQILNNEDLQSCKQEISENKYLIKLKINIDPESQKNKNNFLFKSNYSILSSSPAPFPLKSSIIDEKNDKEKENKDNYKDNKVFEKRIEILESNHLKEMQSINEKINEMDKKINKLKIIIFQFLKANKNNYKKIEENVENIIKNNFDDYEKIMNTKINEINNKLNEQTTKYINEQINKLIPKAKNFNDNKACTTSQFKIIKNSDNMINQNIKIIYNSPKKKIRVVAEKKNEKLEDNKKNEKDENIKNDKIDRIEVENNSNNNSNNLKKESPKKCENKLENANENNIRINYSEKNYRFERANTYLNRYKNNNTINEKAFNRKIEDKKEINNNDSLKEQKPDFQDNSKNIINGYQTNKNNYYRHRFGRLNNQKSNFTGNIKKIEDDNSNLLSITSPNIKISKTRPNIAYSIMNKIFFIDFQQKNARFEKINDFDLEQIKKEVEKDLNEGKFSLKEYCQSFIEENVLPLFKKSNLNKDQFEALKYNIEKILECCGIPNKYYSDVIFQRKIKKIEVDRNKSIEAMRKFRREFGITEKEFNDEGIIKRLEENGLDINKTFQKMFG